MVLRSRKVSSVSVVRKVMREFEKCILATTENRWGREEQGWISLRGLASSSNCEKFQNFMQIGIV